MQLIQLVLASALTAVAAAKPVLSPTTTAVGASSTWAPSTPTVDEEDEPRFDAGEVRLDFEEDRAYADEVTAILAELDDLCDRIIAHHEGLYKQRKRMYNALADKKVADKSFKKIEKDFGEYSSMFKKCVASKAASADKSQSQQRESQN